MSSRFNELLVLELTNSHCHSAYAGRLLGELGARVIEIEPLGGSSLRKYSSESYGSYLHAIYQANKENICLDLPNKPACDILKQLSEKADIILDGLGPGVTLGYGIDYKDLKQANPRLIYTSITTYGLSGAYVGYPDHDVLAQARGGVMSLTGMESGPPTRTSLTMSDLITGLHAAICCVASLISRDHSNEGKFIDMANFDTIATHLKEFTTMFLVENKVLRRNGNLSPRVAPYNAYKCKDGYVVIATASNPQWESLARAIGRGDLISEPDYKTPYDRRFKGDNVKNLDGIIEGWTINHSKNEILEIMNQAHVPCAPVQDLSSVIADEHLRHREMLLTLTGDGFSFDYFPGSMLKLSETKGCIFRPGPSLGMSTGKVLRDVLGYSEELINDLRDRSLVWGRI